MKLCWNEIENLTYNDKKGRWYKQKRDENGKHIRTHIYFLQEETGCLSCGEPFFYVYGNKGICCSLSCNAKYRNSIYPMKESTKKNISKARTGSVRSIESREKQSQSMRGRFIGPNNSNWKGGKRSARKIIYDSYEYKDWRKAVFERDDYTCQICNKRGCELEAHHIKKFSEYPKLVFEIDNGITLCKKCHRQKVNCYEQDWENIFQTINESKG